MTKKDELYETETEKALLEDLGNIEAHALWMARLIPEIRNDPAFKRLNPRLREEIETICAAVE